MSVRRLVVYLLLALCLASMMQSEPARALSVASDPDVACCLNRSDPQCPAGFNLSPEECAERVRAFGAAVARMSDRLYGKSIISPRARGFWTISASGISRTAPRLF